MTLRLGEGHNGGPCEGRPVEALSLVLVLFKFENISLKSIGAVETLIMVLNGSNSYGNWSQFVINKLVQASPAELLSFEKVPLSHYFRV